MFILDWIQQFYAMRYEAYYRKVQLEQQSHIPEEPKVCESCETLRMQLAIVNQQNDKLLARLMEKPEPEPERTVAPALMAPLPSARAIPWRVRQQMLETEDRARAEAMKKAAQPDKTDKTEADKKETEEFEKELADAQRAREQKQTAG